MIEPERFKTMVRFKSEVEFLVKKLATRTGYHSYTVGNVAVLYGLVGIVMSRGPWRGDPEFKRC